MEVEGRTPLVELTDISIAFGGIRAVDHASVDLFPGEVVGLLGHNGAGKSTLIKVLSGAYKRDSGTIRINGEEATINNPRDAKHYGIETIYQTLALADICSGSVFGAHPYPQMVRNFHKVIGEEARRQILQAEGRLPDLLVACVGGGSDAIGLFHAFLDDSGVKMLGVEAGGRGPELGEHAARLAEAMGFTGSRPGVLRGTNLRVANSGRPDRHHAFRFRRLGLSRRRPRARSSSRAASRRILRGRATTRPLMPRARWPALEGIIPALESAHALAALIARAPHMRRDELVIFNLSGRGDKDMEIIARYL